MRMLRVVLGLFFMGELPIEITASDLPCFNEDWPTYNTWLTCQRSKTAYEQTNQEIIDQPKHDEYPHHDSDCKIYTFSTHNGNGFSVALGTYMQHPNGTPFVLTTSLPSDIQDMFVCFNQQNSFSENKSCTSIQKITNLMTLAQSGALTTNKNIFDLDLAAISLSQEPEGVEPAVFSKDTSYDMTISMGRYIISPNNTSGYIRDGIYIGEIYNQKDIKKSTWSRALCFSPSLFSYIFSFDSNQNPDELPNSLLDRGASLRSQKDQGVVGVFIDSSPMEDGVLSCALLMDLEMQKNVLQAVEETLSSKE